MRSLCNLQVCHLVASFCSTPSKGFSWHQVQEGEALLSMRLIRKDAGATPSEHPTSVTRVIGAGQVPAGCTCCSAWGPGPAVSVRLCCGGPPMLPRSSGRNELLSEPGQTQATSPAALPLHAPQIQPYQVTHNSLSVS